MPSSMPWPHLTSKHIYFNYILYMWKLRLREFKEVVQMDTAGNISLILWFPIHILEWERERWGWQLGVARHPKVAHGSVLGMWIYATQLKNKVSGNGMCRYQEWLTGSDDVASWWLRNKKKSPNQQSYSQKRQWHKISVSRLWNPVVCFVLHKPTLKATTG